MDPFIETFWSVSFSSRKAYKLKVSKRLPAATKTPKLLLSTSDMKMNQLFSRVGLSDRLLKVWIFLLDPKDDELIENCSRACKDSCLGCCQECSGRGPALVFTPSLFPLLCQDGAGPFGNENLSAWGGREWDRAGPEHSYPTSKLQNSGSFHSVFYFFTWCICCINNYLLFLSCVHSKAI